jgi:3-methyladenine DNA glycosylase AlkD
MTASDIRRRLRAHADRSRVPVLERFFKTGPGEYAEGDRFIGVKVPGLREVCRACRGARLETIEPLLRSRIHEERLLALLLLVDAFKAADPAGRRRIYDFYLSHTAFINNWDLVDCSAPHIVGGWLAARDRAPLRRLARSRLLWDRRIAILATHHFIRRGEVNDTLAIATLLLGDAEDLIHKAAGWMLREAEKRDPQAVRAFLDAHGAVMPRTMLRYAIERFPEPERQRYLRRPGRVPGRLRAGSPAPC